jgi:hypothetical protein
VRLCSYPRRQRDIRRSFSALADPRLASFSAAALPAARAARGRITTTASGGSVSATDQGLPWAAATALQPGVRVVVQGLVAQPRLNGAAGVVVAAGSRAEARRLKAEGRVKVKLDAGGGKPVALKYGNARVEGSPAE